jgi:hypothetical protein
MYILFFSFINNKFIHWLGGRKVTSPFWPTIKIIDVWARYIFNIGLYFVSTFRFPAHSLYVSPSLSFCRVLAKTTLPLPFSLYDFSLSNDKLSQNSLFLLSILLNL